MFFTIRKQNAKRSFLRAEFIINARIRILQYPFKATERLLDAYLQKKYKQTLKGYCLMIINNLKCQPNNEEELTLTLFNPRLDEIASLITYGNEEVQGSKILRFAIQGKEL